MIRRLHEMDVHFMISIWPTMDSKSDNYKEFQEKRLLLAAGGIYNAFLPEGRRLYWEQVQKGLFTHGVDAWWCDSSEPITPEWGREVKPKRVKCITHSYRTPLTVCRLRNPPPIAFIMRGASTKGSVPARKKKSRQSHP